MTEGPDERAWMTEGPAAAEEDTAGAFSGATVAATAEKRASKKPASAVSEEAGSADSKSESSPQPSASHRARPPAPANRLDSVNS